MTTRYIWLNDRLAPTAEACIPADDWGFLYGDTLFETLRITAGRPVAWTMHARRLERSARMLRYAVPWTAADLKDFLLQTVRANDVQEGAARITVSRGRSGGGLDLAACAHPTLVISVRSYDGPSAHELQRGFRLKTVRVPSRRAWMRYRTKSGNYLDMLLALDEARRAGADEALLVDYEGHVLEGSRSNVFVAERGRLMTPHVRSGILPGIMRGLVLSWARAEDVPARACAIQIGRIRSGRLDEAFVTNSLWGVFPVAAIDGRAVGAEAPGPITRRMMARWERYLRRCARGT